MGDCFGVCCCKEDSALFCRGRFLSNRLSKFSGIDYSYKETPHESAYSKEKQTLLKHIAAKNKSSSVTKQPIVPKETGEEYASLIERVIATYVAPEAMTNQGRFTILTVWALLAAGSIYGASQIEFNFHIEMFIPRDSILLDFVKIDKEHYETGFQVRIVTYSADIDVFSSASQFKQLDFQDKLNRSYLCEEQWFKNQYQWKIWYTGFN